MFEIPRKDEIKFIDAGDCDMQRVDFSICWKGCLPDEKVGNNSSLW